MKKKLLSAVLVVGFLLSSTCQSFAWCGYTHWYMANNLIGSSLSSTNKKAFAGGCLVADLGRTNLDLLYDTESDSKAFANEIVSIANNGDYSTKAQYFASGWKAHYYQDIKGVTSNITGGPSGTKTKQGWIDAYLRDELGIACPINDTATLYVNYNLIIKTYKALEDFTIDDDGYIDSYIADEFSTFNYLANYALTKQSTWSTAEIKSIKTELKRTAALCSTSYAANIQAPISAVLAGDSHSDLEILTATPPAIDTTSDQDLSVVQEEAREQKIIEVQEIVRNNFDNIMDNSYARLVKTPKDDEGGCEVTYEILNQKKYDQEMLEIVNAMEENDLTFDEVFETE